MKRETSTKTHWMPTQSDSVCNEHFVDGIPTAENPNPTLKLGYTFKERVKRRQLFRAPLQKTTKVSKDSSVLLSPPHSPPSSTLTSLPTSSSAASAPVILPSPHSDHTYFSQVNTESCLACITKQSLISI